jgi:hypothetical protein
MIFTLFLGGYLLPKSQYRISEQREYLIYQALCRNHSLDVIDTNIAMIANTIPLITNQSDFDSKIKSINNLLQRKQLTKAQDFFGLRELDNGKSKAISEGFTGDTSIDKLLRLHKLLSKYDIIN